MRLVNKDRRPVFIIRRINSNISKLITVRLRNLKEDIRKGHIRNNRDRTRNNRVTIRLSNLPELIRSSNRITEVRQDTDNRLSKSSWSRNNRVPVGLALANVACWHYAPPVALAA